MRKKDRLFRLEREFENSKSDLENFEVRKQKLENIIKEISEIEASRKEKQDMLSKRIEQDRKFAKLETYKAILAKNEQAQESLDNMDKLSKSRIENIDKELEDEQNRARRRQKELKLRKDGLLVFQAKGKFDFDCRFHRLRSLNLFLNLKKTCCLHLFLLHKQKLEGT